MLALHGAQTVGGAQFYIGCAQLKVTGTGSGSCGPTISIPGAYKAEDDNIYIPNVYNGFDATTYKAPGGPVATCGGSGSAAPSVPTTPKPANSTVPVASPASSPIASPVAVDTPVATPSSSTPAAPAAPVNGTTPISSPAPSTGSGSGALPEKFTIETFVSWLEGKASGSASKARRHARSFL